MPDLYLSEKYVADGKRVTDCKIIAYIRNGESKFPLRIFKMKKKDFIKTYDELWKEAYEYANAVAFIANLKIEKKQEQVNKLK